MMFWLYVLPALGICAVLWLLSRMFKSTSTTWDLQYSEAHLFENGEYTWQVDGKTLYKGPLENAPPEARDKFLAGIAKAREEVREAQDDLRKATT